MKSAFYLSLLLLVIFTPSNSWAFCKSSAHQDECSDLAAVSNAIENGDHRGYVDFLPYPPIFHNGKDSRKLSKAERQKLITDTKWFLKAAMPIAKTDPTLAFYVGSALRQ